MERLEIELSREAPSQKGNREEEPEKTEKKEKGKKEKLHAVIWGLYTREGLQANKSGSPLGCGNFLHEMRLYGCMSNRTF